MNADHPTTQRLAEYGTKIVYTADSLGALVPDYHRPAFMPWTVDKGDVGYYVGPHADAELRDQGWHMTVVKRDGHDYEVPVHHHQFALWRPDNKQALGEDGQS